ncbi:MAG: hypothetical protein ACLQVL_16625 [Terriglobia bacterium]
MKKTLLQHWPLYTALAILLLTVTAILSVSLSQNQGHLVYTLDDPYIGMAMARNFSQYGVWGVTRYAFTSCSSPPLWTLLLSLTSHLLGEHQVAPLVWDLLFALLGLLAAYSILDWYKVPAVAKFITLLGIILLIPLPALIMTGMEPTLQILVSMLTVFVAARWTSGESPGTARGDFVRLLILAPLATGVRFEGMFLIIAIGGILLMVKRWYYALAFCVLGFLPVVVYGIISVSKGWFWLPNSVLLKTSTPNFGTLGGFMFSLCNPIMENTRMALHTPALLIAVLVVYIAASGKGSRARESRQVMGAILLLVGIAHMEFVRPTLLYRYDGYLTALCILFVAVQIPLLTPHWPRMLSLSTWAVPKNAAIGALVLALSFPLVMEGGVLLGEVPQCTTNIFEQQYQMGLFVRKYYQNSSVALNDIGAVDYLADIHLLDLWGLASLQVAKARRSHHYQVAEVASLSQQAQVKIAIIYDAWFAGVVPPEWVRVGTWTIRNNLVAGNDTVSFYAVDPAEAAHLVQCLRDFSVQLPSDVIQRGPYMLWAK